MKNYIGIDLGTTNSAICSYDGKNVRLWKSPEQNDVTPSAIYYDKRGNKFIGKRAYDNSPYNPDNSATLFKRYMGTSTSFNIAGTNISLSPEECSAEILRVLFGYLLEEIRNDNETGTVITVPAAFNQMQKDATVKAAQLAGIGMVALMQEPVAAIMSIMKSNNQDGTFLVYDLGGGTLDIAVAESLGGRVNLLSHGGRSMCGGRDFDRIIYDNVVKKWVMENFSLPEDFSANKNYILIRRLSEWAIEKAKIELSSNDDAIICLSESELRMKDLDGRDIYLDIQFNRETMNKLILPKVEESIYAARESLTKVGLSAHDINKIIFIGGPTNYKPLRDSVSFELGIESSTEVNPMTAVAEGASIFAEAIDWSTYNHARKSSRGMLKLNDSLDIKFVYTARTPNKSVKVLAQIEGEVPIGTEYQMDSLDSGWTSGRVPLRNGSSIILNLANPYENTFKVFVFSPLGEPIELKENLITITRTTATVDAIPASHSIGVAVLDKLGGKPIMDWMVREGDSLPKKGKKILKASESLKAGSADSLNFKLYEGNIEDIIEDNRLIGVMKISGTDFIEGIIPAGAALEFEYEMQDSGHIMVEVSVPCIGGVFNPGQNIYSWKGINDTCTKELVDDESNDVIERINSIESYVSDARLEQAKQKVGLLDGDNSQNDAEVIQEAREGIYEAKKILAQIRKDHIKEIRHIELSNVMSFFNEHMRELAKQAEITNFDNLCITAQRSIDNNDNDFDQSYEGLRDINFSILWRQDWFIVEQYNRMIKSSHRFIDKQKYNDLIKQGSMHLYNDDIEGLKNIVVQLSRISIGTDPLDEIFASINIIRG